MAVNPLIIARLLILSAHLSFGSPDQETNDKIVMLQQQVQDLSDKMESMLANMETCKKMGIDVDGGVKDHDIVIVNTTIEERVTILELQVTELAGDVDAVEDEVILISSDPISQDQRILELEIDANGFEESIEELVTNDAQLGIDFVDLSDTVADQNVTLNSLSGELSTLNRFVSVLNDTVEQMTLSGSIVFHVRIDEYTSIPIDSVVIFGIVTLNIGDGYNIETGTFTVPSGGGGLYFFYTNLWIVGGEAAAFQIRVNGSWRCRAESNSGNVADEGACGIPLVLSEGDMVNVFYESGADDTPLTSSSSVRNFFTGFRISPE